MLPSSVEYELETLLSPNEGIHVLSLELHPICAEYGHETWLVRNDEIRILALDIQPISWIMVRDMTRVNRRI